MKKMNNIKLYEEIINQTAKIKKNRFKTTFYIDSKPVIEFKRCECFLSIWSCKQKVKVYLRMNTLNNNNIYRYEYCSELLENFNIKEIAKQFKQFVIELNTLEYCWEHVEDNILQNKNFEFIEENNLIFLPVHISTNNKCEDKILAESKILN